MDSKIFQTKNNMSYWPVLGTVSAVFSVSFLLAKHPWVAFAFITLSAFCFLGASRGWSTHSGALEINQGFKMRTGWGSININDTSEAQMKMISEGNFLVTDNKGDTLVIYLDAYEEPQALAEELLNRIDKGMRADSNARQELTRRATARV